MRMSPRARFAGARATAARLLPLAGVLFLAAIAPYAGFGVAVLLVWIVWPLGPV